MLGCVVYQRYSPRLAHDGRKAVPSRAESPKKSCRDARASGPREGWNITLSDLGKVILKSNRRLSITRLMKSLNHCWLMLWIILWLATPSIPSVLLAQDKINISYGGHNETVAPLWVGVDKGIFKRYGLDVSVLQVRNGQVSLTALMSGDVQAFWPAVSSVLSGVSGGAKIACVAHPFNKISRELIVRKEIDSLTGLREKIIGVQSIGGGFWLQTMIVLDRLGVDPDKNGLKLRVIGDEPTILQALLASNIDAAVITVASAAVAKRAGLRSLANTLELKVPYQGAGICTRSDRLANTPHRSGEHK